MSVTIGLLIVLLLSNTISKLLFIEHELKIKSRPFRASLAAQMLVSKLVSEARGTLCGSSVILKSHPPIQVLPPDQAQEINQLGLNRPGNGQWAGSDVLLITIIKPGTLMLSQQGRVLTLKDPLSLSLGAQVLLDNCSAHWQRQLTQRAHGQQIFLDQGVPEQGSRPLWVAPLKHLIVYVGYLKNRHSKTALFVKIAGRRQELEPDISSLSLGHYSGRATGFWQLQINQLSQIVAGPR